MINKTVQPISFVCIGLLFGVLLTNSKITAQRISLPDAQDHIKLKFSLLPGGSHSFPLPETDCPVRIEVSTSTISVLATNGNTISNPVVLMTTVTLDSQSGRLRGLGLNDHNSEGMCPSGPDFGCGFVAIEVTPKGNVTIRQFTTGGAQITNPETMVCVNLWF